jgi:hypothetical protein
MIVLRFHLSMLSSATVQERISDSLSSLARGVSHAKMCLKVLSLHLLGVRLMRLFKTFTVTPFTWSTWYNFFDESLERNQHANDGVRDDDFIRFWGNICYFYQRALPLVFAYVYFIVQKGFWVISDFEHNSSNFQRSGSHVQNWCIINVNGVNWSWK